MRRDPRLKIITETIERLIPGAVPAHLAVTVTETLPGRANPDGTSHKHQWTGRPEGLAEYVFTALYGRSRRPYVARGPVDERSPLAQAEEFKRLRNLGGEVGALMAAGTALESAPWYPVRAGDLVHVHYEATPTMDAFGETYIVGDAGNGLKSMAWLAHTLPNSTDQLLVDAMVGHCAVEGADDPIYDLWFEARPQRLTIVRDGRPVHVGGAR